MKKIIVALALLLSLTSVKAGGFGIGLGPKFGYQTTKLSLDKASIEDGFKNHWTAGLFVRIHIGGFVLQPELMYFNTGNVFNITGIDPSQLQFDPKITINQQNLSLPIHLGYMFDGGLFKARITAGPVMNFIVGQKQTANGQEFSFDNIGINKTTWSAIVNLGIDIWFLTLDVSYSFGLSNLLNKESIDYNVGGQSGTIELEKVKQNMFMVTLGIRLFD